MSYNIYIYNIKKQIIDDYHISYIYIYIYTCMYIKYTLSFINIIYYIQYTIEVISRFLSFFHDYTHS